MTPAIQRAKQARIPHRIHEYDHDPASRAFGEEAAVKLGVDPARIFKTLVVACWEKDPAVAVVPVSMQLDLKRFARTMGAKKAAMADKHVVEKTTGYVVGGVSPLGQKKRLTTVIDASARNHETIYVSAGRRGLQIELSPQDLCALTQARFDAIGRESSAPAPNGRKEERT